ncbi:MAG: hypothetical protein D6689_04845 [Deltaproteobacteria bacterium]|nr:MAG: hypothetical protein D6689_04845 [Deltaproteobacteria bacterium]
MRIGADGRRQWRARAAALALALATGPGAGCAVEAGVHIELLLPDDPALSPVGDPLQLAEISLIATVPGEPPQRFTQRVTDGSHDVGLGRLPVGSGLRLAVELRAASQRLIGYGRAVAPVDVQADEDVTIPIVMRRPFAYVTGSAGLDAFDAAVEPGLPYAARLALPAPPRATAPTTAGDTLVAVSESALFLVSTATHAPEDVAPVPLQAGARAVAVTPDDDYAIVGHGGADGGISIVRLDDVRGETGSANFVPLGDVTAVAAARSRTPSGAPVAWALVGGAEPGAACAGAPASPRIVAVAVDNPSEPLVMIEPGEPVTDFAAHPTADAIAYVTPCNAASQVRAVAPWSDPGRVLDMQSVRGAVAVAVDDTRIWSLGVQPSTGGRGAFLVIGSVTFDGRDAAVLELPAAEERALSDDFSDEGQFAEVRMTADGLVPLDLAVFPGADHVGVLYRGYYHGDAQLLDVGLATVTVIPEMDLDAWEYLLVDASTGALVQRTRTRCDLRYDPDAFLDRWSCTQAPGQNVVTGEGYAPLQLAVLNGFR